MTFDESRFVYKYSVAYYIRFEKINSEILNETEFELKEIREVLSKLSEQADNFFDVMHNLNESLYYARRDLNKLNEKYYNGEYCYKEVSQVRESISDMENKLTVAERRFREIKNKTEEYEALYSKKYEFIEKSVVEKSKHVLSDNMPIYYFFKSIYQNAPKGINISKIYAELKENGTRVYEYENIRILLPDTINLKLSYRNICVDEEGKILNGISDSKNTYYADLTPLPKHGASWFSDIAHSDHNILSSEYKKLAKQYHPDVCDKSYAHNVFVEISDEYQTILNSFNT